MNLRERSASLASVARFVAGVQRGEARRSVQRSAFSEQREATKPRSQRRSPASKAKRSASLASPRSPASLASVVPYERSYTPLTGRLYPLCTILPKIPNDKSDAHHHQTPATLKWALLARCTRYCRYGENIPLFCPILQEFACVARQRSANREDSHASHEASKPL